MAIHTGAAHYDAVTLCMKHSPRYNFLLRPDVDATREQCAFYAKIVSRYTEVGLRADFLPLRPSPSIFIHMLNRLPADVAEKDEIPSAMLVLIFIGGRVQDIARDGHIVFVFAFGFRGG
jgi:hypothetical protein